METNTINYLAPELKRYFKVALLRKHQSQMPHYTNNNIFNTKIIFLIIIVGFENYTLTSLDISDVDTV